MTDTFYAVTLEVPYSEYENREHPTVAKIARRHGIKHDGGGMTYNDSTKAGLYEHHYYTDHENVAKTFTKALRRKGFAPDYRKVG